VKLGIVSDAHGSIGGFEAARQALATANADRCIYLGDAVGYIPDISVARRIIELDLPWVAGNHEMMLLEGNYPNDREEIYRLSEVRQQCVPTELTLIRNLPRLLDVEIDGAHCLFVHGSPRDPTFGYVYPDCNLAAVGGTEFDAVFMGHTHRPFVREHAGTIFVNVGSCGLPRDGSGQGTACIFDTATRQVRLLSFSLAAASRAAIDAFVLARAVRDILDRTIEQG
jgi:predicted phosphodiesterase